MYIALIVVHIIVAVSLVLIVLLQQGRGAELGAAFGGLGQATYGRGQYTFVHKLTTALAIIFMVTSLSLAFISTERPQSSIFSPTDARPATSGQPAGAPGAPATPASAETPPAASGGATTAPASAPGTASSPAATMPQQPAPPAR